MKLEKAVLDRYAEGAREVQDSLCCPVDYDRELLAILPQEIIDKDYGCGDPSRYVREGDTVLDLGSGGGKIAYMAAQLVGPEGRVIGVDMNDEMLALARKYQKEMAEKLGGDRVEFRKGQIQDLKLDMAAVDEYLAAHPLSSAADLIAFQAWQRVQRREHPMIPDASVDLVVSNCVLNLVGDEQKSQLVREIARVLKPGGRIAISDIVADEPVPQELKEDPELWSGCISGAFQEQEMVRAFLDAGLQGLCIDKWQGEPWKVIGGIEFRAVTLTGFRPSGEPCLDKGHAVIYRGPFSEVRDDDGHFYPRGERIAVCERTFRMLGSEPYAGHFIGIEPAAETTPRNWCAEPGTRRPPSVTKGGHHEGGEKGGCC